MPEEVKTVKTVETTSTVHTVPPIVSEPKKVEQKPYVLSNVLAIAASILVILVIIWGLLHLAGFAGPWLSSLFKRTASTTIQVTAPMEITSGDTFTVRWNYSTSERGTYAFLYQCKDGLRLETTGNAASTIPCGAAFTVPATANALALTPVYAGSTSTSALLSVIFMPSATSSKQARGDATISIKPKQAAARPEPVKPATPATPVRPAGPADLSVQILSVVSDGAGGAIATFDIGNNGSSATGAYTFTAQLPTIEGKLYSSPVQVSLASGDHVVNTLSFSQAVSGVFSVVVDPTGTLDESSTSNNYASQSVSFPYYTPQYQQPYQYQSPYQYPYGY